MPVAALPFRPRARSRVSNGKSPFALADARSAWGRRFRDLLQIYSSHIGGEPTAPQMALIRRIATLDCEAERLEGELANGQTIDLDEYNRLAGNQRRLLDQLGFERAQRDITPDLQSYIKSQSREVAG